MPPPGKHAGTEFHLKAAIGRLYTFLKAGFNDPDPRWLAEKTTRVAALKHHVHGLVKTYLDEWKDQMDVALTDAKPSDEKSRFYWYVALAGNLLWAATCFINLEAAVSVSAIRRALAAGAGRDALGKFAARTVSVETSANAQQLIAIMSVGGALIGSGTAEQLSGLGETTTGTFKYKIGDKVEDIQASGNPEVDGKYIARLVLAYKRGELEELYRPLETQWASEIDALAQWGGDLDELMDNYLWTKLFPRLPYVPHVSYPRRFVTIYQLGLNNMKGALEDYNRQWGAWLFKKERSSGPGRAREIVPGLAPPANWGGPDPGPFQPKLNFDMLAG